MNQKFDDPELKSRILELSALLVSNQDATRTAKQLAEALQNGSLRPLQPGDGVPTSEDFQYFECETETLEILSATPDTK